MIENYYHAQRYDTISQQSLMLQQFIDEFANNIQGLRYCIIATDDGFPIANTPMTPQDAEGKAAMTASLEGLGETVAYESDCNDVQAVQIECSNGFIFSRAIYLDAEHRVALLLATTGKEKPATILYYVRDMVNKIQAAFAA
ncbi:MAG: roadblock/LC7 domain-containing protein [Neisseriaceae bacterium]|nr:roadblock/LC7 domain-containing protein [Neisseriaceae bacterium]MBQ9183854.1 roadblock/LC7 domain-containing protein [Neisseriaceae bacterium]MBQ9259125.1 roadblock/LC7 domain-containing protein [Neisseriaceae bacterium]MBQ9724776.1 roadblock/LC7 domain-containing protein [Neisseriaceae bacterium]MBR1819096.1 roadblock/LC7 domain-containing protein [Neisseriaceae bacterium]